MFCQCCIPKTCLLGARKGFPFRGGWGDTGLRQSVPPLFSVAPPPLKKSLCWTHSFLILNQFLIDSYNSISIYIRTFKINTGCPKKNGDLEFSTFCILVSARLYDHFQNKSKFVWKLNTPRFDFNVDFFRKWSYNRALTQLKKVKNPKSPFFLGHHVHLEL